MLRDFVLRIKDNMIYDLRMMKTDLNGFLCYGNNVLDYACLTKRHTTTYTGIIFIALK